MALWTVMDHVRTGRGISISRELIVLTRIGEKDTV